MKKLKRISKLIGMSVGGIVVKVIIELVKAKTGIDLGPDAELSLVGVGAGLGVYAAPPNSTK